MLFNSFEFLLFFPVVAFVYFVLPFRFRWPWLLLSSYYFYMCWKPEYVVLIILSTLIDYYIGLSMAEAKNRTHAKHLLTLSIICNLGVLFAFKYYNFFNASFRELFSHFNIFYNVPSFKVLLPVGISFYTFQSLSYTIDVYSGKRPAEKHLGLFALYIAFFPQLVAGPIERSTHLLPQLYKKNHVDYQRVTDGLKLILWGLFKKIVIADRLAYFVNYVYNNPAGGHGYYILIATYFFAFQIYCDFSGYSDIAIGSAQVMGYELMENFKRPYLAQSIPEFWKRWHISLSTWFKEYLYFPLGGNRVPVLLWARNILVVFLLSGIWHGANWTFFV
ncbi:MAG: MBOAT family protein [Candidatus Omnitrophota bacterium]